MTDEYLSSDFNYKKYSLEHLDNWLHDAINCEDLTPQDIYDTIVKCVDENIEYHKKYLTKNIDVLSLLKGQRPVDLGDKPYDGWDYTVTGEKFSQYTEEEMDAMCERAATENDKDKCREYNLREAEYYRQRAMLDAKHSKHYYDFDRNDPDRANPFSIPDYTEL